MPRTVSLLRPKTLSIAALAVSMGLAACASVAPMTALRLARADPMSADPAGLRAAIRLPQAVDLLPDGVTLSVNIRIAGDEDEETQSFALVDAGEETNPALADHAKPGFAIHTYRLSDGDAAALSAFRGDAAARARASGRKDNALKLGISIKGCRRTGQPGDPIPFATFLALDPRSGYRVLTREMDLKAVAPAAGSGLPACP